MILRANFLYVLFVVMVAACRDSGADTTKYYDLKVAQNGIEETVRVEAAATPSQRQQGLMFRDHLDEDKGMIFLFPAQSAGGFWMRNTYVALDIAYIGADGRVQEIRAATPLDETPLTPAQPYRYVLEVNQGWFERHGLGVGAQVTLPEGLPVAQ